MKHNVHQNQRNDQTNSQLIYGQNVEGLSGGQAISPGPQLKGKLNIYCGDMDNYYLNNAVYLMEEFL